MVASLGNWRRSQPETETRLQPHAPAALEKPFKESGAKNFTPKASARTRSKIFRHQNDSAVSIPYCCAHSGDWIANLYTSFCSIWRDLGHPKCLYKDLVHHQFFKVNQKIIKSAQEDLPERRVSSTTATTYPTDLEYRRPSALLLDSL